MFTSHYQRDWQITLNGSCDSVLLQAALRGAAGATSDIFDGCRFGFSSVFSLQPFNSAAIESCNRAAHNRDISRSLHAGDAFADVVFIAEGVRFPAHKVWHICSTSTTAAVFSTSGLRPSFLTRLQVIVSARCVHFRSMFNSQMREAVQVNISCPAKISGFNAAYCMSSQKLQSKMQDLRLSREFWILYTGFYLPSYQLLGLIVTLCSGSYDSDSDDGGLVLQVLLLSDRYMLPGLKRQCEAVLRSRLDQVFTHYSKFFYAFHELRRIAWSPCFILLSYATRCTYVKHVYPSSSTISSLS
jgi:hypothetical protein